MRQTRWVLFVAVILSIVTGSGWWFTQPRLTAVEPPADAKDVPGSTALRLSFSLYMQPESVVQRLQIQPPVLGDFRWEGKTLIFTPLRPWQSGSTVRVRLDRGAQAQSFPFRRLNRDVEWVFQIGHPQVLYLFPFDGAAGLYLLDPMDGETQLLSEEGQEVFDYALSANGAIIFFTARLGSGSAIYRWERRSKQVELLLPFPDAQVRFAQLSPSEEYLAYELTELREVNAKTHVWVASYPPQGEAQAIRLGDATQITRTPLWSAQNLLAYYDQSNLRYRFYDPSSQREVDSIKCQTGEKAAWSADGEAFLFAEILPVPETMPTSHLFLYRLATRELTDLSQRKDVEDVGGVFSPQGDRVVFARKFLDALQWTPGRQPWMLDLPRNEAQPLWVDVQYNHYDFMWSPNADQILFVRFNQMSLTEPPEIWVMQADGSQPRQIVKGGYAPQWMP